MPKPKGGLGRGLGSLIPQGPPAQEGAATEPRSPGPQPAPGTETSPGTGLLMLPVESISPNPHQPRQAIGEKELDELAGSIREHGVLQPVVVTRAERTGQYNLVAGERRWRAAELAGLETIPAIVKEATSRDMLELALVENLQRADLNPLEQAAAYKSLVDEFGLRQEDVAARVGKSRQAVTNALRLLQLPLPVQESLALGMITEGHARAILQVPDETLQVRLAEQTVAEDLSVRQVEELARQLAAHVQEEDQAGRKPQPKEESLYDEVRDLEERFRNALGTKVQLSRSSRGGRLVIYFYSDEELGRLFEAIVGEDEEYGSS